jgi:hypothetical protein
MYMYLTFIRSECHASKFHSQSLNKVGSNRISGIMHEEVGLAGFCTFSIFN